MTEEKAPEAVTFKKLGDAINFVADRQSRLRSDIDVFKNNFKELTGYDPDHRVSALDVMTIVYKLYGEPNAKTE